MCAINEPSFNVWQTHTPNPALLAIYIFYNSECTLESNNKALLHDDASYIAISICLLPCHARAEENECGLRAKKDVEFINEKEEENFIIILIVVVCAWNWRHTLYAEKIEEEEKLKLKKLISKSRALFFLLIIIITRFSYLKLSMIYCSISPTIAIIELLQFFLITAYILCIQFYVEEFLHSCSKCEEGWNIESFSLASRSRWGEVKWKRKERWVIEISVEKVVDWVFRRRRRRRAFCLPRVIIRKRAWEKGFQIVEWDGKKFFFSVAEHNLPINPWLATHSRFANSMAWLEKYFQ